MIFKKILEQVSLDMREAQIAVLEHQGQWSGAFHSRANMREQEG